jgi:hypothetical protein
MLVGNDAAISDFESISTTTVGAGGTSSITFSSIPQTYSHLQIRGIVRGAIASTAQGIGIRVNGSTPGQNYYTLHSLNSNGSAVSVSASASRDNMNLLNATGASATSGIFGSFVCDILDYTNTNKNTTIRSLGGNALGSGGSLTLFSGLYTFTTAITSITINSNNDSSLISQYSHFALYGIRTA